jgi:hypothetical protein
MAPLRITSNWSYTLRLTPAAEGVWMFTSGTPLGATRTFGRKGPGTPGPDAIWAWPVDTAIKQKSPAAAADLRAPPGLQVALEAPLPVLHAVS